MASLTSQTISGSYEQLLHTDVDGGLSTTLVPIKDGDNGVTSALLLAQDKVEVKPSDGSGNSTTTFEVSQYDGTAILAINSTTPGATITGTATISGVIDSNDATDSSSITTGSVKIAGGVGIEKKLFVGTDLDVAGVTNLDAVDIDSTVQIDGTTTLGSNTNGQDLKIFGAASGSYWEFDASQNSFSSVGAAATSAPKFGVGVANPDYACDIRTDTGGGGYAAFFWNGGNGGDRYGISVRGGGVDPSSQNTIYFNATDSDDDQVGYLWNTSGTFALVDASDKRLKDNIRDTSVNGLDSIKAMKVRDFEWKKGGSTVLGGFIAQEMNDAFSSAVAKPDWEEGKTKDEIMWGVSRERLVPVLVKAMQELETRVATLEG